MSETKRSTSIKVEPKKKLKEENQEQELRKYTRTSLRNNDSGTDLTLACDGVTVKLIKKTWWKTHQLGIANIKDFGLGGIGILTSTPLEVGQEIIIELNGMEMAIEIARTHSINSKLNFAGAKWLSTDNKAILSMINQIKPA